MIARPIDSRDFLPYPVHIEGDYNILCKYHLEMIELENGNEPYTA